MQFNLSIRYIRGSRKMLADALSRVFQDASNQERKDYESKYMHEIDDFISFEVAKLTNWISRFRL